MRGGAPSRRRHLSVASILASFAYLATQVAGEHGERRRGHKEHEEGQGRRVAQVKELERDQVQYRRRNSVVAPGPPPGSTCTWSETRKVTGKRDNHTSSSSERR